MATHAYYRLDHTWNAHRAAQRVYQRAYRRGQLALLWSTLTGRARHLFNLAEVVPAHTAGDFRNVGKQRVPIRHIRGSWERCADFDVDFHPLKLHNRERWLKIAVAWGRGAALPPVRLIQVGDVYFVQDGHHRISVARALGQKEVDAWVSVCDVAGPLPSRPPASQGRVDPTGP